MIAVVVIVYLAVVDATKTLVFDGLVDERQLALARAERRRQASAAHIPVHPASRAAWNREAIRSRAASRSSAREFGRRALHRGELIITPPLFAIPFGIAGLCGTWRITGPHWTTVVGDVLAVISAVLAGGPRAPPGSPGLVRRASRSGRRTT